MNKFQQGWAENRTKSLQEMCEDLKATLESKPEDMLDCERYSEDYPLGGCIEQYDIEIEKELTR